MAAITADGPANEIPLIRSTARELTNLLEDFISTDVSVVLKTRELMPERTDGGVSNGYWKKGRREIWLYEEVEDYPIAKTLAHEAMHVIDSDWLTPLQREAIMEIMFPRPEHWRDQRIDGEKHKYVALPFETFAVYASAAIKGFDKPAYRKMFERRINPDNWEKLARITLRREDDAAGRNSGPAEDEFLPSPPPTAEELEEQLALVQAELTARVAAREAAEISLALAEGKLTQAKTKAAEIGSALGIGDVLTATERAREIEAL